MKLDVHAYPLHPLLFADLVYILSLSLYLSMLYMLGITRPLAHGFAYIRGSRIGAIVRKCS